MLNEEMSQQGRILLRSQKPKMLNLLSDSEVHNNFPENYYKGVPLCSLNDLSDISL